MCYPYLRSKTIQFLMENVMKNISCKIYSVLILSGSRKAYLLKKKMKLNWNFQRCWVWGRGDPNQKTLWEIEGMNIL